MLAVITTLTITVDILWVRDPHIAGLTEKALGFMDPESQRCWLCDEGFQPGQWLVLLSTDRGDWLVHSACYHIQRE